MIPPQTKAQFRSASRSALQNLTPAARSQASAQVRTSLQQHWLWQQAHSILFYAPLPGEVDLWPLLEISLHKGKQIALPRHDAGANRYLPCRIERLQSDLMTGKFNIREPASHCVLVDWNSIQLALVPGLGFDLQGNRLGRGRGYYDRLLENQNLVTCGVAFDEVIYEQLPVQPHDQPVHFLVTPTRLLQTRPMPKKTWSS